jgi:hypothetical protein
MSALPPKADMFGATRDVRFGPIADIIRRANAAVLSRAISRGSYPSFSRSISIRILRASVTGELE